MEKYKESIFYKNLKNKAVQCTLCNHYCYIDNNYFGLCNARKNIEGKLYTLTYGKPVAINIDPIEKKPLFHFLPGSFALSIGTFGCNFKCKNCLNYDISQEENIEEKNKYIEYVPPEQIVNLAINNNCKSIAYTYNEPTIFSEYALDIMKIAKEKNIKNIWVSNGFMSKECLEKIIPYLDATNIDIKSSEEEFYKSNCNATLKPILENLKILKKNNIHIEITTLVIPTLSDKEKVFTDISKFIIDNLGDNTPWHLSRFSPEISWKLKDLKETDIKTLELGYNIGKRQGLNYIYIGNIYDTDMENTYCPKCNTIIVKRLGYNITRFDINGYCPRCKEKIFINE
ncbi:MAG TPA: AmmeMemoRadiSam system radical SAM enzyme [bacterium]|nr:AmmeMemoRadiSam system radical SAM enzyme [bacterium]HQL11956.1 AmmeMemoRadiSam system radical SAM enzyme [bacterium]